MRSRGEAGILRLTSLVALVVATWLAYRGPVRPPAHAVEGMPSMAELTRWAVLPPADTLRMTLAGLPTDTARARVAALAGAGMVVQWRDRGVLPIAAEGELDTGTGRGVLRVAGGAVEAEDAAGPIGVVDDALVVPGLTLPVRAGSVPSVELVPARRAVVVGAPSWEARWIVRGLEATGWQVEANLALAPGLATGGARFDTARVAVVIALDRVEPVVARLLRAFVRSGGGLVMAPDALATPALAQMAPGGVDGLVRPPASLALPAMRSDLAFRPVVRLADDAVVLDEGRVAARREGRGRVVLVGDVETWRWALASDAGREAHAAFWARVIEAARYRPLGDRVAGDPAPRVALVAAFGAPVDAQTPAIPRLPREAILFGVGLTALLAEWGGRRMRGAV